MKLWDHTINLQITFTEMFQMNIIKIVQIINKENYSLNEHKNSSNGLKNS